jgi:hypothetical protein
VASIGPAATRPRRRRFADFGRLQALRLTVFVRRVELDEELASGLDPASHPAHTLRAAQLLRPRSRRRLASTLERLVDESDAQRVTRLSPAVPFLPHQVGEARATLLSLVQALRGDVRIRPRGAAMVLGLLEDPTSALYSGVARGALQLQAQTALECLLGERQLSSGSPLSPATARGGSNGDS